MPLADATPRHFLLADSWILGLYVHAASGAGFTSLSEAGFECVTVTSGLRTGSLTVGRARPTVAHTVTGSYLLLGSDTPSPSERRDPRRRTRRRGTARTKHFRAEVGANMIRLRDCQ